MNVPVKIEGRRGCGYRKPGGLYLVSGVLSDPCPLLPIETKTCPTCGEGIKPARGYTWIDWDALLDPHPHGGELYNLLCPLSHQAEQLGMEDGKAGLIWIGEQFYPTPQSFTAEAAQMGVSRRISALPRGFQIGTTWVLLGHRKALTQACSECGDEPGGDPECPVCEGSGFQHVPGIISAFRPTAVEYVVRGDEPVEELEAMTRRGITPVRVEQAADPQEQLAV